MQLNNIPVFIIAFLLPTITVGEISSNITLSSDYISRGVSQTIGDPAIQGSIEYSHENEFYAGTWASNVDYYDESAPDADPIDDDRASHELDFYAGYSDDITDQIGWDISLYLYTYPDANRDLLENNEELFLGLNYENIEMQLSRDFDNEDSYCGLDVPFPFISGLEASAHVGHYDINSLNINYDDYSIMIKKQYNSFSISAIYTDTNMNDVECTEYSGFSNLCDGRLSILVSKDF